ncbi:hypothetical protein EVU96_25035 [Bacillus infantis]|uniref:hypothetical protein n=1 Tax=Bacillus infantis TaxID=324767 RepID=UPI00101DAE7A|nr:hypothetical protein [Bacillus infantis]RYI25081.1 hypothetical protein EVU96_25035 [Bacillus infantis]
MLQTEASEHNWKAAKDFYIKAGWRNGVTLQTVAEKYSIPYQSVRRRASQERWRLIREWKSTDNSCKSVDEYIKRHKS